MSETSQSAAFADPEARRLAEAIVKGDIRTVQAMLSPNLVNARGQEGETPLLLAVERLDRSMIDLLLSAGAAPDGAPGCAPLAVAVRARDLSVARRLLAAGADPNGRMGSETALHRAVYVQGRDAVDLLLAAGATIDAPNKSRKPASFIAAGSDQWTLVLHLLDRGGALAAVDRWGITLGHLAAESLLLTGSLEGTARDEVISRWRSAGLPWPPPPPDAVLAALAEGRWPPPQP